MISVPLLPMVLQKRWITDDQTKWRQYYNGISQTVSDQPTSSLANHTRWYPSSPWDDLSGADLLVVGPKAVVIPSYMPRLSATISTQLDAFIQFQPAFICTVSRCSLNNARQWWISTTVTYHRGRNDLIDDFEPCLVCEADQNNWNSICSFHSTLARRLRNNSPTSTLPSEI